MYHSNRLRTGRYSATVHIYLITINCKARAPVFSEFHTARCFVHALQEAQLSSETLAYVVMPDHVHWLMQLKDAFSLSESVRFVKAARLHSSIRLLVTTLAFGSRGSMTGSCARKMIWFIWPAM